MAWFSKCPMRRCIFAGTYLLFSMRVLLDDFALLNFIPAVFLLIGSYIALEKSTILKSSLSDRVDDFKFDFLSLIISCYLLLDFCTL